MGYVRAHQPGRKQAFLEARMLDGAVVGCALFVVFAWPLARVITATGDLWLAITDRRRR